MKTFWRRFSIFSVLIMSTRIFALEDVGEQLKAVHAQLEKLSETVQHQQQTIEAQQQKLEDQQKVITTVTARSPIAADGMDILKRINNAETHSAQAIHIAGRKKANDLNMAIGAAVDTAFRYFDGPKNETNRPSGNDFQLRGAELVFYQDIDPYFKSYLVVNAVSDASNHDEAIPAIEEAAIATTSLSHVQVKGGRFFVPFGRLSMIHDHDLPFTTRPPVLDAYVGGESGGDGVQVQALVPIDHFLQITAGAFNKVGSDFPLLNGAGNQRDGTELTYFAKALTSFDFCQNHSVEAGLSTLQVPNHDIRRDLTDLEVTYRWHPAGSTLKQRLVWGTELLRDEQHSRFESAPADLNGGPTFASTTRQGYGGYTYVEYFLNRNWSFGPRIDLHENIDPLVISQRRFDQTYTAFVTYNFSEFGRVRFEGSRHEYADGKYANEFFMQWTAFWGAHTHGFEQR